MRAGKINRRFAVFLLSTSLASCVSPPAGRPTPPPPVALARMPAAVPLPPFRWTGDLIQGGLIIGAAPEGSIVVTLNDVPVPLARDGRFIIGFDRDAGPAATLIARAADGRTVIRQLAIAARQWAISRLGGLPKYPVPAPAFAALRPPELAQIAAARHIVTDADGWRQRMIWPTIGRISTLFGSQRIYRNGEPGAYHSGIDIAKPQGSVIVAPADGVVILAADHPFTLEGNLLMLDHGMGVNTAFLHLSRIDVRVGDHVRQGQPIALTGMTGRATGPHLHWGLQWRGVKLDPLLVAGPMLKGR